MFDISYAHLDWKVRSTPFLNTHLFPSVLMLFTGDPILSHLERQSETLTLHLQPGERQSGSVTAHL